ncbi:MMPL family transporter [Streptomyces sp. NPDC001568]|uniref:MMPL family transporter n=1 Tax=Streptomyces sp. NPDC001568 TaxID=3364588 RepID=UPI003697B51F
MAPSVKTHVPLVSLIVICGWILLAFISAPFVFGPDSMAGTQRSSLLPRGAESTAVAAALEAAPASAGSVPLVVVWTATRDPQGLRARAARSLSSPDVRALTGGARIPVLVSRDGYAAAGVLPIRTGPGKPSPARAAAGVRAAAARAPWTTVALAGPAAVQADLDGVFDGVDSRLLVVALVAVLLILLVVYRSPLLPLLVIATSLLALAVSCAFLYGPARAAGLLIDGQVQGILFVLIIGATTDYGLLLTARYREELGRGQTGEASLRLAWRRSLTPLSAGAATVTAGLLALMLSDLPVHRSLGAAGAIAMGSSLLCALTFLPAALGLLGPAVFWPRRKRAEPVDGAWLWQRIAAAVVRRPRGIWAYVLGALVLGAALSPVLSMQGIPLDRALASTAPSVRGQAALERSFPGGLGNPAIVLTDPAHIDGVTSVVARTGGVARADIVAGPGGRPETVGGRAQIAVTLTHVADSQAAMTAIRDLRTSVDAISGAAVQVGGQAAEAYDMRAACAHDRLVIMPVALALIALILVLLLRCLLLPLLLVLSVVLSFLSALGVCAVVAHLVTGSADTEPTIVLYSFVFLVALGVDYNIFLMHRVREEAMLHGTRVGVRRGLVSTAGVISSAGIVLATTFAALTVMPLAYLVHIGAIVAIGVVLDTLVVRLFLVPALVTDLGPTVWWPAMLPSDVAAAVHRLIGPRSPVVATSQQRLRGR